MPEGRFTEALKKHQNLADRFNFSRNFLEKARNSTASLLGAEWPNVAIFAAGSLGRLETGRSSDLDVFFLAKPSGTSPDALHPVSRLEEISLFAKLIEINTQLNLPKFSGDGRYLKVHDLQRVISSTGDAHDDSENLFTTRLLLLLESKSLWNDDLRKEAISKVLAYYFKDGKGKKDFRPLFFLNDVLRYWRTLCLNYERDRVTSSKWWKTNLNLKFSRKLTVFSTVLIILTKAAIDEASFISMTEKVPLERLAYALDVLGDNSLLEKFILFLDDYESFLAAKSHDELHQPSEESKQEFRSKAENFGEFLHTVLMNENIDATLRRYVLV